MKKTAVFSPCGRYRYWLTREWDDNGMPPCVFVMLNPSTADDKIDDPTIRRCINFAKKWGYGKLIVVNIFAVRSTDPIQLYKQDDPVGEQNMDYVKRAVRETQRSEYPEPGIVICGWGVHGAYMQQGEHALGWIEGEQAVPRALRVTKSGHPTHPLYIPADTVPAPIDELRSDMRRRLKAGEKVR